MSIPHFLDNSSEVPSTPTTSPYVASSVFTAPPEANRSTTPSLRQLRALKTLNAHLATRTFFVGERITLADIFVAGVVTVIVDAAA
ncbi:hypothetical protein DXG03_005564, partial [Asterophora parasitica]